MFHHQQNVQEWTVTVDLGVKGTFQSRVLVASVCSAGTSRTTGEMTPPFAAESVEKLFVWCLGIHPRTAHLALNATTHATLLHEFYKINALQIYLR